jgi:protease-4
MFPTFEETLAKIGVTTDGVGTTALSGAFRPDRSMDEELQRAFQLSIENGYQDFISKVAENREMSLSEVDAVARGRVWSGEDAHRIGLVDQLGGLEEAVASAAEMAGLEEWHTRRKERTPSWRERFIGGPAAGIMGDVADRRLNQAPHRRVIENLRQDLEQLDTFNDPNNLYYYCDRCVIEQ